MELSNTDDRLQNTNLAFNASFNQVNYLYDYDGMQSKISKEVKDLCRKKSIKVSSYRSTELGATGGELFLQFLMDIYHNNAFIFAVFSRLKFIVWLVKSTYNLVSKIRMYISEKSWKRYEAKHEFDHAISIDIQMLVKTYSTGEYIKKEITSALNELLLLLPELKDLVNKIYPDYTVKFNITALSIDEAQYGMTLHYLNASEKQRRLILKKVVSLKSSYFPVTLSMGDSKLKVTKNASIVNLLHSIITAKEDAIAS